MERTRKKYVVPEVSPVRFTEWDVTIVGSLTVWFRAPADVP